MDSYVSNTWNQVKCTFEVIAIRFPFPNRNMSCIALCGISGRAMIVRITGWSTLGILLAWCFHTRASVAAVLRSHPCFSICFRIKKDEFDWIQPSAPIAYLFHSQSGLGSRIWLPTIQSIDHNFGWLKSAIIMRRMGYILQIHTREAIVNHVLLLSPISWTAGDKNDLPLYITECDTTDLSSLWNHDLYATNLIITHVAVYQFHGNCLQLVSHGTFLVAFVGLNGASPIVARRGT